MPLTLSTHVSSRLRKFNSQCHVFNKEQSTTQDMDDTSLISQLKRRKLALFGHTKTIVNFHLAWEQTLAVIIYKESDRPSVYWVCANNAVTKIRDLEHSDKEYMDIFSTSIFSKRIMLNDALNLIIYYCEHRDISIEIGNSTLNGAEIAMIFRRYADSIYARTDASISISVTPKQKRMAICGRMGPIAGASFAVDLGALIDHEQLPDWTIFMYSDPSVESYKETSITETMLSGTKLLSFISKKHFQCTCIPSNTAHLIWSITYKPKSLISIFDAVGDQILQHGMKDKVGFMTTDISLKYFESGYASVLQKRHINYVLLDKTMQKLCMEGINEIKNPHVSSEMKNSPKQKFIECAKWLHKEGAKIIIMACTEIPLGLDNRDVDAIDDLFLIDSSHCLALAVYDRIHSLSIQTGESDRQI